MLKIWKFYSHLKISLLKTKIKNQSSLLSVTEAFEANLTNESATSFSKPTVVFLQFLTFLYIYMYILFFNERYPHGIFAARGGRGVVGFVPRQEKKNL